MEGKKDHVFIINLFVLLLVSVIVIGYLFWQKLQFQKTKPLQQAAFTSTTTNWITYWVLNVNESPVLQMSGPIIIDIGNILNDQAIYKLPPTINKPLCSNTGCYYRDTLMPGHTTLAIIPIGPGLGWSSNWDQIISQTINKNHFLHNQVSVNGKSAILFSGQLTPATTGDVNLLTDASGPFRGILIALNSKYSLEIIHYQDKFTKGSFNFDLDDKLFDQILSTFKFLP